MPSRFTVDLFRPARVTPSVRLTTEVVPQPAERPGPPPTDVVPPSEEPRVPFLAGDAGWSQTFSEQQNTGRKQAWVTTVPLVAGEPVAPFQVAASGADTASMVTNLGTRGVEQIDTDLTLALARLPAAGRPVSGRCDRQLPRLERSIPR